jgi:hypothetical protein
LNESRRRACGIILKTLALAGVPALSAGTAAARPRGAARFRLWERLERKLVAIRADGVPTTYELVDRGRFDLDIHLPVSDLDVEAFDADTTLTIEVNDTLIEVVLGDDPGYAPGRKRIEVSDEGVDAHGIPFVLFRLVAQWNSKELRIQVAARTPDGQDPILAQEYLGAITSPLSDFVTATVGVGDASFDFEVDVTGRTATHTVIRAKQEYEPSETRLAGSGYAIG